MSARQRWQTHRQRRRDRYGASARISMSRSSVSGAVGSGSGLRVLRAFLFFDAEPPDIAIATLRTEEKWG